MTSIRTTGRSWNAPAVLLAATLGLAPAADSYAQTGTETGVCDGIVVAKVVALDQAFYINRLGALQAGGMIFALESDVRDAETGSASPKDFKPGQVVLRPDKRPRPIVLRVNKGDCLQIEFTNLLSNLPIQRALQPNFPVKEGDPYAPNEQLAKEASRSASAPGSTGPEAWIQPPTRYAGVHVAGMQLVGDISADGSWVGANGQFFTVENPNDPASYPINSGLVPPGKSITYTLLAGELGSYLLNSEAATTGLSLGFAGQLSQGLFGSVNVQPQNAEWYRSQVSQADLALAAVPNRKTADGHPVIDYAAVYVTGTHYPSEPGGPDIVGTPILKMYKDIALIDGKPARELVHTDLTAVITGPKAGIFSADQDGIVVYDNLGNPIPECIDCTYPERVQPYREVTVLYHDDFVAKQSFAVFGGGTGEPVFQALQGGRDFFAINYGMGAIGPPIWANRLGVGPMFDCATCKYEEFFLSSWPNGDPAMVVDFPANSTDSDGNLILGKKATKAFYPDDPSNVYHSYVGDHTVYRILHAGANITHVHHQHAHQWLHTPNSDNSHYRDSQMISPGAAYTLDYVYRGGGNKNQTPGDSIFHCHFYPHFAQGMWALWRVHDTFEAGTHLDPKTGIPEHGEGIWNRALPDGEIPQGSPTPAVVPLPTIAMAPMPARVRIVEAKSPASGNELVGYMVEVNEDDLTAGLNPGFPFYVAGVAGQRATHPPLDFAPDLDENGVQRRAADGSPLYLDGGLPRHIALSDNIKYEKHNRWDFTKNNNKPVAMRLPETGTAAEVVAMNANAIRTHPSFTPDGTPATFLLNGLPPVSGAPIAEPGIRLDGSPVTKVRQYKAADIELDVVFNKKGWHYPQQRITALWGDVADTLNGKRAAEPLFFRANSDEVVEYWLANLVPNYYELDDFQVRTPTDVLGQHIHLVKFDVLASDGAANGFNYEDGTYAAQEVRELIGHINDAGGIYPFQNLAEPAPTPPAQEPLEVKTIPYFGDGSSFGQDWNGAQATVQRWYADPLLNHLGEDRTIRTVFTHDHFSPSTHQQAGLYAGLVVEPEGSTWRNPITGDPFGDRLASPPSGGTGSVRDGGPTSWAADIITADPANSYREFNLEFQDRQLTYKAGSLSTPRPYPGPTGVPNQTYIDAPPEVVPDSVPSWGWSDPSNAINRNAINPPFGATPPAKPHPLLVTNRFSTGTLSLNYRNEPLLLRMFKPEGASLPPEQEIQASDLSYVFASIPRFDPPQNCQPNNQMEIKASPFTCIPEVVPPVSVPQVPFRYENPFPGAGANDPYTPLMRAYEGDKVQIRTLVGAHMAPHSFNLQGLRWLFEPADTNSGFRSTQGMGISEHYEMLFDLPRTGKAYPADYMYVSSSGTADLPLGNWGLLRAYNEDQDSPALKRLPNNPVAREAVAVCPQGGPVRQYDVTATTAQQALGGPLVYNGRGRPDTPGTQRIVDWNALFYVHSSDLDAAGRLRRLSPEEYDSEIGASIEPLILRAAAGDCLHVTLRNNIPTKSEKANLNIGQSVQLLPERLETSRLAGLHAELVSEDVTQSNGVIIGRNPMNRLAEPGKSVEYTWYAGIVNSDGKHVPVEFGSAGLTPSDPLMQSPYGLIGALVIEPQGSCWTADPNSRASANVYKGEFVEGKCDRSEFLFREHVTIVQDNLARLAIEKLNPGDRDTQALEGVFSRAINYGTEPIQYRFLSSGWQDNTPGLAPRGQMRAVSNTLVLGDPETPVFTSSKGMPVRIRMVHPSGLVEQTWTLHGHVWQEEPYVDGSTKIGTNPASQWFGARDAFGPNNQFDIVIAQAGGEDEVTGDYLYRSFMATDFFAGMWGIFRVGEKGVDVVTITGLELADSGSGYSIIGVNSVNPSTQEMAEAVTITDSSGGTIKLEVDETTGAWGDKNIPWSENDFPLKVTSTENGVAHAPGVINAPAGVKITATAIAGAPGAASMFTVEQTDAGEWPPKNVDGEQFRAIPFTQNDE